MKEKTFKSNVIYALTGRPCENCLQEAEMAQVAEEHEFRVNEKQEKPDIFYLPEIFLRVTSMVTRNGESRNG